MLTGVLARAWRTLDDLRLSIISSRLKVATVAKQLKPTHPRLASRFDLADAKLECTLEEVEELLAGLGELEETDHVAC